MFSLKPHFLSPGLWPLGLLCLCFLFNWPLDATLQSELVVDLKRAYRDASNAKWINSNGQSGLHPSILRSAAKPPSTRLSPSFSPAHIPNKASPTKEVAQPRSGMLFISVVFVLIWMGCGRLRTTPPEFMALAASAFEDPVRDLSQKTLAQRLLLKAQALAPPDAPEGPFPLLDPRRPYNYASPGVCDVCASDPAVRQEWVALLR
eukprot:EG_transcript_28964